MQYSIWLFLLSCFQSSLTWKLEGASNMRQKRQSFNQNGKRLVCYHTSWSSHRKGSEFSPDDIDPFLCTHLLYAYATADRDSIVPFDPNTDIQNKGFEKFTNLKKINPDLNVILSVGGGKAGSAAFSRIAGDPQLRTLFAKNGLDFLKQFGFTGLDVNWKYPGSNEDSNFADKANYVLLLQELRKEFGEEYSISITVPPFVNLINDGFDLPEISKYVDFMTVLTYSYHRSPEAQVFHSAPLYQISLDPSKELNIDFSIMHYVNLGVDPQKLNLAMNLFGINFILEDPDQNELGSSVEDEGAGTQEQGAIIYNQLCQNLMGNSKWTVKHVNKSAIGPYMYLDKQWISFDDEDMIRTKTRYAVMKNLGGVLFWAIDMDDFQPVCHSTRFPLIRAAGEELGIYSLKNSKDEDNLVDPPNSLPPQPDTPANLPTPGLPRPVPPGITPSPPMQESAPSKNEELVINQSPPTPIINEPQNQSPQSPQYQPPQPPQYQPPQSPQYQPPQTPQYQPPQYQPPQPPQYQPSQPPQYQPPPYQPPQPPQLPLPNNASPNSIYSNRDVVIFHNVNIWTIFNNHRKD